MKTSESKFCSCLYFTTNALARKVEKLAVESWKKIGLAPSHAYLLKLVIDEPGMQAGVLAEQLQLTPSTITRLIEKLEEKKLVTRVTEGKTTNVFPTQKAKEMKPQIKQCIEEFHEKYVKILGKEESKQFIQNMNIMADKL
ncbi:MAG: MarR family transcriptional regulator [Chitinophagaceae bacterium]|nr:MarR family transcriptional regulator [Bacteroidota bacterium]TAJ62317.1 MAG: MarR family transcriptional regulator [Chitinophagaceae bacterium]